jgi:Uma2 family endonuclease
MAPPEERVLIHDVSWDTYQRLLAESVNNCGTRFTYNEGELEIMVVNAGHESPNRTLASIAEITAEETGLDFWPTGSTTFQRSDLLKGFEPDSSFYFQNAGVVQGKAELDLQTDPPPELVIEVDISRSSLRRFPIFAAIGVAEVWRYDGKRVRFYGLSGGEYREIEKSHKLPPMTAAQATTFLKRRTEQTAPVWLRSVREWVRSQA